MNSNPYAPPQSKIEIDRKFKRSIWWKIYFYPITVLGFVGGISLLKEETAGFVEYLLFFSNLVATVGFFGFVYLKQFLFPKFWIVFLFFFILFGVTYEFFTSIDLREGMSAKQYYISMIIGYIISLPSYYALFSYGRKNNSIWNTTNVNRDSIPTKMRPIFVASYICGIIIYLCTVLYIRYVSSIENVFFSQENSFLLVALFSTISALYSSYHYNKNIAHPLYHPIFLFFKLLFSKSTLLPSLFCPLGVYSGHWVVSIIYQKEIWRSIFIIGTGMLFSLYVISLLGSFVGIFISNRKLSPSL
jgi:hypothetical protein